MKKILIAIIFALSVLACSAVEKKNMKEENMNKITAKIQTNKGDINLTLFAEKTPVTVANFVNLANRGYYDSLNFHRVMNDFMIQGGCPNGDGRGGPGYNFKDEFTSELKHNKPGILSMANAGPGTNGSQFFITHVSTPWLNGKHTVFGEIISDEDLDVVNSIVQGDQIIKITIDGDITELMEENSEKINEWNASLNSHFPELSK